MGSTDNFLPGTVLSPVATAAATVPDIEMVEVAEMEDVLPCFWFFPIDEVTEVGTMVVDEDEDWTNDVEVGTSDDEVEIDDEEAGTSVEVVWTDDE